MLLRKITKRERLRERDRERVYLAFSFLSLSLSLLGFPSSLSTVILLPLPTPMCTLLRKKKKTQQLDLTIKETSCHKKKLKRKLKKIPLSLLSFFARLFLDLLRCAHWFPPPDARSLLRRLPSPPETQLDSVAGSSRSPGSLPRPSCSSSPRERGPQPR